MTRRQRLITEILALALTIFIGINLTPTKKTYDSISYTEFKELIENQEIDSIGYNEEKKYAVVHSVKEDAEYKVTIISSEVFVNDVYEYSLTSGVFQYDTFTDPVPISTFSFFLIIFSANITLRLVLKYWFMKFNEKKAIGADKKNGRKKEEGLQYLGKFKMPGSNFELQIAKNVPVRFSDVIGLEKQINELKDIVSFLKEPKKYQDIGAKLPKGIILWGQSGVGKTLIARAIAGEANVPFIVLSASELQTKYLGESEERIRQVFETARSIQPCIVFIDEIDSIATKRYSDYSNRYQASIINQLLSCMDGFARNTENGEPDQVVVIAATNHIETLDDALLRNGRFDRKVFIHAPDKEARRKLIVHYSQDKQMVDGIDIDRLVDFTVGLTGADIETILNEAGIIAVGNGQDHISEDNIMEAFRKVEIGSENSYTNISKDNLEHTAVHEAGHAVVHHYFGQAVSEISIIARGRTAGYNLMAPNEQSNYGFTELKQKIMCLLGGRAAETLIYNEALAGASGDLESASSMIKDMFLRFAMSDGQGISLVMTDDAKFNEILAKESFDKMDDFMKKCFNETMDVLRKKIDVLRYLADRLLEKETLSKEQIEAIFAEIEE